MFVPEVCVCVCARVIDTVYLVFFEMETDKDVQFLVGLFSDPAQLPVGVLFR